MRNIDIDEVKSEILELEIIQESNENELEKEETELGKLPLMVFMSIVFIIFIIQKKLDTLEIF
jgi:hypothetical protein